MKRFIVFLALVCMGALTSSAFAGDYHTGVKLICSDCHIMHASKQHTNIDRTDPVGGTTPFVNLTPNERLLIGDINETCLNCHDASNAGPDVYGENTGMYAGVTRMGGGLNGTVAGHTLGNTVATGAYGDMTGHTLGSMATAPGGTWSDATEGLACTNCHSAHGSNYTYRNLTSRPGTAGAVTTDRRYVNYEVGTTASSPQTKDVLEATNLQTSDHYDFTKISYEEPSPDSSHYAAWCQGCHTKFHGVPGNVEMGGGGATPGTNAWLRHPTGGMNLSSSYRTRYAGFANKLKVMDSQGLWTGAATDTTLTPSCMTCHKAHGNGNPFGLVYMAGTGATVTEEGDGGAYRDMCRQCHSQGS